MRDSDLNKHIVTRSQSDFKVTWPDLSSLPPEFIDHVLRLEDVSGAEAGIHSEFAWIRPGAFPTHQEHALHAHPFDQVLAFFGSDIHDQYDLGGEVELVLNGRKINVTKSFLAFLPAGMKHSAPVVRRADKSILHFSVGSTPRKGNALFDESVQTGEELKYIVTELRPNIVESPWAPPVKEPGKGLDGRVMWLDDESAPGACYMDCAWFLPRFADPSQTGYDPTTRHKHDYDELIAFFGTNPNDVRDLGGELWLWLGDEKQVLTESCMIRVPAGTVHCPLVFYRIDKPIFHFSCGPDTKRYF